MEEFSEELYKRISSLEELNENLLDEARRNDGEKKYIKSEMIRLQKEIQRLRFEIDRMKTPPMIIGTIKDVLTDGRVVVKSSTGPDFIVNTAEYISQESVIIGSRVALNKQSLAVVGVLPSSLDPIVLGGEVIEKPETSYDEIGGLEEQIVEIREAVEDPLLKPELFQKVGIEPPKGVLLIGVPGTGKTLLAKAVAHQTNATFIKFVGSELVQKYIGEGARVVRDVFEMARKKSPSIIFIDELDAIGAKRFTDAGSGDREVQRTLMQLLAEMDGFDPRGGVRLLAATNRPDILDPALLRPGRFDRLIHVSMPNREARTQILRIHTANMNLADDVDLDHLASLTNDANGADLKAIVMEAGMCAVRGEKDAVYRTDFEAAIKDTLIPVSKPKMYSEGMFA
ncbi:MAG: proteasome-activating nucleotidase [Methanosarcinales archaeon]|nr:proteasome-activating nucleotidase [Methanosarcinales archaeon]